VLGTVVAGCGPQTPVGAEPGVDAGSAPPFSLVVYQGEEALGGPEIVFDSVLGSGTPVVLNFWAAQCPPCRLEMPWFETVSRQYEGRVLMVGVDLGPFTGLGTHEQGEQLLEELAITYPAGYAVDDTPVSRFDVVSMPTTVFFDGAGELVEHHPGLLTEGQVRDWFEALVAAETA